MTSKPEANTTSTAKPVSDQSAENTEICFLEQALATMGLYGHIRGKPGFQYLRAEAGPSSPENNNLITYFYFKRTEQTEKLQADWDAMIPIVVEDLRGLFMAGAEFKTICRRTKGR